MPLIQASTHVVAEDRRTRKLLVHREEIDKLIGAVERKGYTLIPTALYWKNNRVKVEIGLARGKQEHDKRETEKERDWNREKQRTKRSHNRDAWIRSTGDSPPSRAPSCKLTRGARLPRGR